MTTRLQYDGDHADIDRKAEAFLKQHGWKRQWVLEKSCLHDKPVRVDSTADAISFQELEEMAQRTIKQAR